MATGHERARLEVALRALPPSERARLQEWASQAEDREPANSPARLDKLMASAGGGAARYRQVTAVDGQTVYYTESHVPFAETGKNGRMTLAKWRAWAARASLCFRAPLEIALDGVAGRWLHWEILDALGTISAP